MKPTREKADFEERTVHEAIRDYLFLDFESFNFVDALVRLWENVREGGVEKVELQTVELAQHIHCVLAEFGT